MKPIEIQNKKLAELITLKDDLVTNGRTLTTEIEKSDKKIEMFEKQEKKITAAVAPDPDLKTEGDALAELFQKTLSRLEEIGNEIQKKKLAAIPESLESDHKAELKNREHLEKERNKIALRIQKIKNKVIPIIQKETKPFLKQYDDIETATAKNDTVYVTTFNHLVDWENKFKSRQR